MGSSTFAKLHSLLPDRLLSVFGRQPDPAPPIDEHSLRGRDERINTESTPPEGEHIDLRCVWAVEFYAPGHIGSLEASLLSLGWNDEQDAWLGDNPILWLRNRRHQSDGSSVNLGLLTTADSPAFIAPTHRLPCLPDHVSYAQGWISSLTPSLVAISLCFVLDDSYAERINTALHERKATLLVPKAYGQSIHDPYFQKRDKVAQIRHELQQSVQTWYGSHLPGAFASLSENLPTCELITAKLACPFVRGESDRPGLHSYIGITGFKAGRDSYRIERIPGLVLDIPRTTNQMHLAVKESDLDAVLDSGYGERRAGSAHYMDLIVAPLLQSWAILPLLEGYARRVVATSVSAVDDPEHTLDALRDDMFAEMDIAVLSSELGDETADALWILDEVAPLRRVYPYGNDDDSTLQDNLRFAVKRRASWLKATDTAARDNSVQYGTLLAAVENIRLQRSLKRLTIIITILTTAAIAVAIIAPRCL